jgi:hypothetical protein
LTHYAAGTESVNAVTGMKVEREHFAAEARHGGFEKIFCVSLAVLDGVCYTLEVVHCDRARPIEAISNSDGVDAAIKEGFTLF